MNTKKGFTLVELLAVIVILAVILVIAVPKIMDTISNSKEAAFKENLKLITNYAEKKYVENQALGITDEIKCEDVIKLNKADYSNCNITFDEDGKAEVVIVGSGKFDGIAVCDSSGEIKEACYTDAACFAYEDLGEDLILDINEKGCNTFFGVNIEEAEMVSTLCSGGKVDGFGLKDMIILEGVPEENAEMLLSSGVLNSYEFIEAVSITGYDTSCGTDVWVPNRIDNKVVTKIGDDAFTKEGVSVGAVSNFKSNYNLNNLRNIVVKPNLLPLVTVNFGIGITSIKLPNTVTSIGNRAFLDNNITEIDFSKATSLVEIGEDAFKNNDIEKIKLPKDISVVYSRAFQNNNISGELDLSYLPSLSFIFFQIFDNNNISSIKLHKDVSYIGEYTFSNNNIKVLDLSYLTKLETIDIGAFTNSNIEEVIFPEGLERINGFSFMNNKISILDIPSSVIHIEDSAFAGNNLTNVVIGNANAQISDCAFGNLSTITTHNIPSTYVCK